MSLEVDARHWIDAADFAHAEDSMATKDQLVESLFAHITRVSPGQKGSLENLTTLVLRDVKLGTSKYTWFTYLSLEKLQRLELRDCKGADVFVLQLTSGADIPILKAFTMVHDVREQSPDRSLEAIEQLLQDTGSSIVSLELCCRNARRLPNVNFIIPHGGSLRRLLLDMQSTMSSWNTASGQLLEQLAIALPEVSVEYHVLSTKAPAFDFYIKSIAKHCKLEILSLLNLPSDYAEIQPTGYFNAKDKALARLADDIFAIHRSQHPAATSFQATALQVVAFGTRERADNHLGPRFYVPYKFQVHNEASVYVAQVAFAHLQKNSLAGIVLGYERRDFDKESRKLFHPVEKEGLEWQGLEDVWQSDGC